jgi:hypothetical protein
MSGTPTQPINTAELRSKYLNPLRQSTKPATAADLRAQYLELRRLRAELSVEIDAIEAMIRLDEVYGAGSAVAKPAATTRTGGPATAEPKEYFTIRDLQQRFHRSAQWVRRKVKAGELRPVKSLGRPFRFSTREVENFEAGIKRHRA